MNVRLPTLILIATVLLGLGLLWITGDSLPLRVASHFDASGAANGYMPRPLYLWLIAGLQAGIPLLLAVAPQRAIRNAGDRLNLPNKDYWLQPQRRAKTLSYLAAHGIWFAELVALFLLYMQWWVLQANVQQPPHLSPTAIGGGLAVFLVCVGAWLLQLFMRFRRPV